MGKNDLLKAAIVGMRHGHVGKPGEGNGYLETLRHLDGSSKERCSQWLGEKLNSERSTIRGRPLHRGA